jgi:hypothetical protein
VCSVFRLWFDGLLLVGHQVGIRRSLQRLPTEEVCERQ